MATAVEIEFFVAHEIYLDILNNNERGRGDGGGGRGEKQSETRNNAI